MLQLSSDKKILVLGTALWGWGITRDVAHAMLAYFFENGGTVVDVATNYPINQRAEDHGLAIRWLAEWLTKNPVVAPSVIVKVGSVDNRGGSDSDLRPETLVVTVNRLRDQFGDALSCVSVHWDVRDAHLRESIDQTVMTLNAFERTGLAIGLSGIKHPELYANVCSHLRDAWIIQVKENISTCSARESYQPYFPHSKYLAYGINLGGLKDETPKQDSSVMLRKINPPEALMKVLSAFLEADHDFTPRPSSFSELALAGAYTNPALAGVITGPRNVAQLTNTLYFWQKLQAGVRISDAFISLYKREKCAL